MKSFTIKIFSLLSPSLTHSQFQTDYDTNSQQTYTQVHPAILLREVLDTDVTKATDFVTDAGIHQQKYKNLENFMKMSAAAQIFDGRRVKSPKVDESFTQDGPGQLRSLNECDRSLDRPETRNTANSGTTTCKSFAGLEAIWGYGCHCYFGSDWDKGRGTPVNQVDGLCHDLNTCYQCITIDAAEEGDSTCEPAFQSYVIPTSKDIEDKGLEHACGDANFGDNCAIRTCCCDTRLADGIINYFFDGLVFDPAFSHDNGWDPSLNCPIVHNGSCRHGDCEIQCCGQYPNRFPFKTGDSIFRECCVDTVYNSMNKQCCNDGTIVGLHHNCP